MSENLEPARPPKNGGGGRMVALVVLLVLLAAGGAYGYHVYSLNLIYQSTDDAQVDGDYVAVAAEVAARVKAVHVKDNQSVKAGDLLVELDDRDYRHKLEQAEKSVESARRRVDQAQANLELTRKTAQANVDQASSSVRLAEAGIASAQFATSTSRRDQDVTAVGIEQARANLEKSRTGVSVARADTVKLDADLDRYRKLYAKDEVSKQQLDSVQASASQAHDRLAAARRDVEASQAVLKQSVARTHSAAETVRQNEAKSNEAVARVGEAQGKLEAAQVGPEQVAVAQAQIRVARSDLAQAKVAVELARLDVERTRIVAPAAGLVTKKSVLAGSFLQRGSPVLSLVLADKLWVVANFKETQLEKMRPGQEARIWVDTYPDHPLDAHVDSFQAGTGAKFSLLPPENAAGSFVKVVQRVPVKLTFDVPPSSETPVVPGMSVEARVKVQ